MPSSSLAQMSSMEDSVFAVEEASCSITPIRRAVSDSYTLSKALSEESICGLVGDNDEDSCVGLDGTGLESSLVYGPNSPRKKSGKISGYALVSALSESISQNFQQSIEEPVTVRANTVKRNSWQHSRDRKAQYIAGLERTVNILQTLYTELEVKVVSQKQQVVALSMENNDLRQQLAKLEDQIFFKKGVYQLLKEEKKRLKLNLSNSTTEAAGSLLNWQMLDMAKLNLS